MNAAAFLTLLLAASLGRVAAAEPAANPGEGLSEANYSALINGDVLHANTLELGNLALSDVVAKPLLKRRVLTFDDCHASAYGGNVAGSIAIDFTSGTNHCVLDLSNIDLAALIGDFGVSSGSAGGKLSGHLDLSFPTGHTEQLTGHGSLSVKEGSLVELSFLTSLLLGDVSGARGQDAAEAAFEVRGGNIKITSGSITTPETVLLIKGTVSLEGDLRLLVIPHPRGGLLSKTPLIGQWWGNVLDFATSHLARAVVRGHLSKPETVINPFAK